MGQVHHKNMSNGKPSDHAKTPSIARFQNVPGLGKTSLHLPLSLTKGFDEVFLRFG